MMHVKKNIYIWMIELMIFLIMLLNMFSFFVNTGLISKMVIVISLMLSCVGVLSVFIFQPIIRIKKKGIGVCILGFVAISSISSAFNYKGAYHIYNAIIVLTLFASVYFCLTSKLAKYVRKQQISSFFFGLEIILSIVYLIYRLDLDNGYFGEMNIIYFIILILPLVLMNENKNIVVFGTFLIAFLTVISFKRNAFFMIFSALIVYFILVLNNKNISRKKKVMWSICILFLGIIICYFYIHITKNEEITLIERMGSILEDGGSGRSLIYKSVINEIKKFTIFEWLLGRGYNGVFITTNLGTSAHNDFLEILFDYGIIALLLYSSLIIRICNITAKMFKKNYHLACISVVAIILFMFMSTFSHLIIYPTYILYFIVFWSVMQYENNAY